MISQALSEQALDQLFRKARSYSAWQEKAVEYARIMSRVKWTPVAGGMPKRGGCFEEGTEYTGVPYSSVKCAGRYIGSDVRNKYPNTEPSSGR